MGFYKHSAELVAVIATLRQVIGKIIRDYKEIEVLQSSTRGVGKFAICTYDYIYKNLYNNLLKICGTYGIILDGTIVKQADNESKAFFVVNVLDGMNNFANGLPFFCTSIAIVEISDTNAYFVKSAAIYSPILDVFIHAEKDKGAYLHDRRVRVSSCKDIDKAMIFIDGSNCSLSKVKNLDQSNYINCVALTTLFVACAKADIYCVSKLDISANIAALLILKEAGGLIIHNKDYVKLEQSGIIEGEIIITNGLLAESFRH